MIRICVTTWLFAVSWLFVLDYTSARCTQGGSIFNVTVVCSNIIDLSDLNELSSRIDTLDLSNRNNIFRHISGNMFEKFKALKSLNLGSCSIRSIDPLAFNTLRRLSKLDLSKNSLKYTTSKLFDSLVSLEYLDLSYNQLSSVDEFNFKHNANLVTVNLANCGLSDVSRFFLGTENYLKSLDLSNNLLTSLDFLTDIECNFLESLNLAGNKISSTTGSPFVYLSALRTLDLRNNQIASIEDKFFEGINWNSALYLDGNKLTKVPKEALKSIDLRELTLSGNPVDVLDSNSFPTRGVFNDIKLLKICDMPNLTEIGPGTFRQMRSLQILHISRNNKLSNFSARAFDGLVELSELKLEDNALNTLDRPSINLINLDVFELANNPWTCDCRLEWMEQLKNQTNFSCHTPSHLKGRPFKSLTYRDLCPEHHMRRPADVLETTLCIIGIVVGVLILVILVTFRYKKNFKGCKRDGNPYTLKL